jgi:hypothetical protein
VLFGFFLVAKVKPESFKRLISNLELETGQLQLKVRCKLRLHEPHPRVYIFLMLLRTLGLFCTGMALKPAVTHPFFQHTSRTIACLLAF